MSTSRSTEFYRRQRETNTRKYCCPTCDKTFYNKSQLNAHMLKHTGETPYHCNCCTYKAKQKFLLDKHKLKMHNIPLPSTRTSRYRMRTSEPPIYGCKRIVKRTNKQPKLKGELQKRIDQYDAATNILDLPISKKHFSMDKSRGFIEDYWVIYLLSNPRQTQKTKTARKNTQKIAHFMNQIATIKKKFPNTFEHQLQLLREDNHKQHENINIAVDMLH